MPDRRMASATPDTGARPRRGVLNQMRGATNALGNGLRHDKRPSAASPDRPGVERAPIDREGKSASACLRKRIE